MTEQVGPGAEVREVPTRHGAARVHLHRPTGRPRGLVVLGHGAGGGVTAPDLEAATAGSLDAGFTVALVEQPYRVAGRRTPPRAPTLDEAWTDVLQALRPAGAGDALAVGDVLVLGGRSSGARVACRTATSLAADGVLCLAFPTRPPGRPDAADRLPELASPGVPVLVLQGRTDPYGVPPDAPGREVHVLEGDHSLRKGAPDVARLVAQWLARLTGAR